MVMPSSGLIQKNVVRLVKGYILSLESPPNHYETLSNIPAIPANLLTQETAKGVGTRKESKFLFYAHENRLDASISLFHFETLGDVASAFTGTWNYRDKTDAGELILLPHMTLQGKIRGSGKK